MKRTILFVTIIAMQMGITSCTKQDLPETNPSELQGCCGNNGNIIPPPGSQKD